jgi:hypothetical protein
VWRTGIADAAALDGGPMEAGPMDMASLPTASSAWGSLAASVDAVAMEPASLDAAAMDLASLDVAAMGPASLECGCHGPGYPGFDCHGYGVSRPRGRPLPSACFYHKLPPRAEVDISMIFLLISSILLIRLCKFFGKKNYLFCCVSSSEFASFRHIYRQFR